MPPGIVVAEAEGFTLREIAAPEGYEFGETSYTLSVEEVAGRTEVRVAVDSTDLRLSLLSLEYPQRLTPIEGAAVNWPGTGEILSLVVLDQPSAVHFGAALPRLQERSGPSGSFDLLRVNFDRGRTASAPPMHFRSIVPNFVADSATGEVSFSYVSSGDYDQNSEVNAADLVPIAARFGDSGPWSFDQVESVIDGDGNGEINAADITPIAGSFLARVEKWHVYTGPLDGAGTMVGEIPFSALVPADGVLRRVLSQPHVVNGLIGSTDEAAWIVPVDGTAEGISSNRVPLGPGSDTTPPVWTDDLSPGVLAVAGHDGSATVYWGEATDAESGPVTYTVYYNEGSTVDFETAQTIEVPASDPFESYEQVEVPGLTNGTEYAFAVRAKDNADPPNEEANETGQTATLDQPVEMPDTISGDETFSMPMIISGGNTVTINGAAQLTFERDLHIDGTLLGMLNDVCIVVEGDLFVDGEIIVQGSPDPVPDGTEWNNIKIVAKANYFFGPSSMVGGDANIYIVDDEADLWTPQEVIDDTDTDANPEDYPFNFMPDNGGTSSLRVSSAPRSSSATEIGPFPCVGFVRGDWGIIPTPPKGVKRVVLNIRSRNGRLTFQDFEVTGLKGRKGDDDIGGCAPVGGKGEDAFRLRIHVADRLTFENATFNLGDGGDGGDASTDDCCDAVAVGGDGGKAGKFRFTAGNSIRILGGMTLNPGQGGTGGVASAFGADGTSGCPCTDGCNATATGGKGEDSTFGIAVRGNVNGIGSVSIGPAHGGDGGTAIAFGGHGGDNTCCPGGTGCLGGFASATGGEGGSATFGALAGATGGGATGGDGGDATSFGGDGGDGASCSKFEAGGDGGDGGDASSNGGAGGGASGNGNLTDGAVGSANATGGDGGNGGNGCPEGGGGAGGAATAVGTNPIQTDGNPGGPGLLFCPITVCIPLFNLVPDPSVPGPIPDGFSGMAPLLDRDTMEELGQIPFEWYAPGLGELQWAPNNDPPVICFINSADLIEPIGVTFDLDNINWLGDPLPIVASDLGVNFAQTESPTGSIGKQETTDMELQELKLHPITPVPAGPETETQSLEVDSFFDITYRVEVQPQATVFIEWFYLIDP